MWCYQKPGFEALLLSELQRQQQCSQFCDTLLKSEGIAVPAHSCILSAISPHISSALSSAPPPPAGQSHLLEFRALGACTLFHMVRLLYCGEMAGEGENEKQEAISAAAKLGIHGLVEVTQRDRESGNEDREGCHTEVGVQTEPPLPEENEGGRYRWRREVRDGSTFLWKETLSDVKKDTWTQTEELQLNTGPFSHQAASFETIDMAALQTLEQTDSYLVPPPIPYIPVSLVYHPDENQTHQSAMQESTAAGHTSVNVAPPHILVPPPLFAFPSQATPCAADPQNWCAGPQGAARNVAEEWEDERLEQFQGNIPGYINDFLKPEGACRGRARGRRRAGAGGARRAGAGEGRARRPRGRTRGRGRRGGLMQTVDVQDVGVSRLQKLFLQRWGMRASVTGQGGGAAGRKLYLKTREFLKPTRGGGQRRRGRGKAWEFSQSADVPPYSERGGGKTQRGQRSTTQDGLAVGRAARARAKLTTSTSLSSPHVRYYSNVPAFTSLPPAAPPPPHEEQREHFDRLLEEVMMGLDILPNNNSGAPHSQPPLPGPSSSSAYASCGNTLAQNKQRGRTCGLLEPGFHGSTQVVAVATGSSSSANSELPVLQQQGEGELDEMLDHFLQSFERHVDHCAAREDGETGGQRQPNTVLSEYGQTKTPQNTPRPASRSQITVQQQSDDAENQPRRKQPRKARSTAPPEHTEASPGEVRAPAKRRKRRQNEYQLSLEEKKKKKVRKPVSPSDANTKNVDDRGDKQLQQMPVVKLERSGPLPATVILQDRSCLEVKKPAKRKTSTSSEKTPAASWSSKMYPIRSRFREAHVDSRPFLEELPSKSVQKRGRARPRKNGQLLSLSESSTPTIEPQPVEPCGTDEQPERNQERREDELTVRPREEAERAQPTSETRTPNSASADAASEPAARELRDVSSVGDFLQRKQREEEEPAWSEIKLGETEESFVDEKTESGGDEVIDVGGPTLSHLVEVKPSVSPSSRSVKEVSLGSTGSWQEDEDIDVIGGSSPVPDPVIISWSSQSEEEEGDDDVDVVGEKTDYASSAVFAAVSKGECVNRTYHTEVLLH